MKKIHILALIPVLCFVVGNICEFSYSLRIRDAIFIILGIIISVYYIFLYGACVRV